VATGLPKRCGTKPYQEANCDKCVTKTTDLQGFHLGAKITGGTLWSMEAFLGRDMNNLGNNAIMAFDSSVPTGGDPDLGAPNQRCGGPGQGVGGEPGKIGANCKPLGKVAIAHEQSTSSSLANYYWNRCAQYCRQGSTSSCTSKCQPDDNAHGAIFKIVFKYESRIEYLDMLDIDEYMGALKWSIEGVASFADQRGYGDNSVIRYPINQNVPKGGVMWVVCHGSCAFIKVGFNLCPAPAPTCVRTFTDFQKYHIGQKITGGPHFAMEAYRTNNLNWLGNNAIMAYDTSVITGGDTDLGSPNQKCGGPGIGWAGEPGRPGANCNPLGIIAIANEASSSSGSASYYWNKCEQYCQSGPPTAQCLANCQPDDNAHGGAFKIRFPTPNTKVLSFDMLDLDEIVGVVKWKIEGDASFTNGIGHGENSVTRIAVNRAVPTNGVLWVVCSGSCGFIRADFDVCS